MSRFTAEFEQEEPVKKSGLARQTAACPGSDELQALMRTQIQCCEPSFQRCRQLRIPVSSKQHVFADETKRNIVTIALPPGAAFERLVLRGRCAHYLFASQSVLQVSYSCRLRPLLPDPGAHHLKSPHVPSPAVRCSCVMWCSPNPRATAIFPSGYFTAIVESSRTELLAVTGSMILPSFH